MFALVRVYTLAPENEQAVIAVEPCHFRVQGILHRKDLGGHQGCDRIRRIDRKPCAHVGTVYARIVAASIPCRITDFVFGFCLKAFDSQTENIRIGVIVVVTLTIGNGQEQFVLAAVAMFLGLQEHGIHVRMITLVAQIKRLASRIDSVRRFKLNLQLAQVLVLVLAIDSDIVTKNRARKFIRLVVIRLVCWTRPF